MSHFELLESGVHSDTSIPLSIVTDLLMSMLFIVPYFNNNHIFSYYRTIQFSSCNRRCRPCKLSSFCQLYDYRCWQLFLVKANQAKHTKPYHSILYFATVLFSQLGNRNRDAQGSCFCFGHIYVCIVCKICPLSLSRNPLYFITVINNTYTSLLSNRIATIVFWTFNYAAV